MHIADNISYFLNDINRISNEEYLPTDLDILQTRQKSTTIVEYKFRSDNNDVVYRMVDVGGTRYCLFLFILNL